MTTTATTAAPATASYLSVDDAEKYCYGERSLPYLASALAASAICVIVAQIWFETRSLIALPFVLYTALYVVYQALSLPVNFAGKSFDMAAHHRLVEQWRPATYPSVDIFLPICGEETSILANTWAGVRELIDAYPGISRAFVLDDGPSDEARDLAEQFGITYLRRPNQREFKKSGNLKYGYDQTDGEHIVIFDADFRPHPDFLAETLPYMEDPETGIVQTPQYFRTTKNQTWVERGASASLEVFYRGVQVCRDRFGSALCVGSNAVYRRSALAKEGGFSLVPFAEDSHTGLDARFHGYRLRYLPVVLAIGVCPPTIDSYMRQQYRWSCGATSLICTNNMWRVPMPLRARLPYLAGWLWNVTTAARIVVLPLIPVTLLIWHPEEVEPRNFLLLIPAVLTGALLYPLWHKNRYPLSMWPLAIALGWAQALALWDYARGKVMSWQPARGPGDATRRFRKAVLFWNGTLSVAWLLLAIWRGLEYGSARFAVLAVFGVINTVIVARVIWPGEQAR
jgi:cellulose synthase (UDP-forming)